MKYLPELFERNRAWAARRVSGDAGFFRRLCDIQRPDYLWIGCSDSRVPANEVVGLAPGELFVHRNVANVVSAGDRNCMAVVEYAIEALGVPHLVVCGHYGCGGVQAALEGTDLPLVSSWLASVRDVAGRHRDELDSIEDPAARRARLCELNVAAQVKHLAASSVVSAAVTNGRTVMIHGWIYDLQDGLLRDLGVTTLLEPGR